MDGYELLWSSGATFLSGVTLDAVDRNHPTAVDKLNIEFAGFDQRGDPRCRNFEVQRCVFKCSARRFPIQYRKPSLKELQPAES